MHACRSWPCLAAAIALAFAIRADALPILMTLDGHSQSNRDKAALLGHQVSTATLAQLNAMTQEQLAGYRAIFVSPDLNRASYAQLRTGVADGGTLQHYVATGGTLVLNVAGRYGDQQDIAPAGVDYVATPLHNAETLVNTGHPYLTGAGIGGARLTTASFDSWLFTDHGFVSAVSLPPGTKVILTNDDGRGGSPIGSSPSLVEYRHARGKVVLSVLTIGWAVGGEAGAGPQENLIQYALIPEPGAALGWAALAAFAVGRRRSR